MNLQSAMSDRRSVIFGTPQKANFVGLFNFAGQKSVDNLKTSFSC